MKFEQTPLPLNYDHPFYSEDLELIINNLCSTVSGTFILQMERGREGVFLQFEYRPRSRLSRLYQIVSSFKGYLGSAEPPPKVLLPCCKGRTVPHIMHLGHIASLQ